MNLSTTERRYLESLRQRHRQGTSNREIGKRLLHSALYFGFYAIFALGVVVPYAPKSGWALTGIAIGMFLRDVVSVPQNNRLWPLTRQIITWPEVDDLLAQSKDLDDSNPLLAPRQDITERRA